MPTERPNLPTPVQIETLPIVWVVLTADTIPEGDEWVFIALTPQFYENMTRNEADTTRWVTEALWQLKYYRREDELSE